MASVARSFYKSNFAIWRARVSFRIPPLIGCHRLRALNGVREENAKDEDSGRATPLDPLISNPVLPLDLLGLYSFPFFSTSIQIYFPPFRLCSYLVALSEPKLTPIHHHVVTSVLSLFA